MFIMLIYLRKVLIILLNSIYNEVKELTADEIRYKLLEKSELEYEKNNDISYKVYDVASLFVASVFLNCGNTENKEELRKDAYLVFLSEKRDSYHEAWQMIDLLLGRAESSSKSRYGSQKSLGGAALGASRCYFPESC